jgi:hypothetical protein
MLKKIYNFSFFKENFYQNKEMPVYIQYQKQYTDQDQHSKTPCSLNKLYNFIQNLQLQVEILPIKIFFHSINNPNNTTVGLTFPYIDLKSANTKLSIENLRNNIYESRVTGMFFRSLFIQI